jgi:hypothetical protein
MDSALPLRYTQNDRGLSFCENAQNPSMPFFLFSSPLAGEGAGRGVAVSEIRCCFPTCRSRSRIVFHKKSHTPYIKVYGFFVFLNISLGDLLAIDGASHEIADQVRNDAGQRS